MAVNINVPSQVKTYANLAAFPATGALKTIYIAEDTNKTYRWTGSVYTEISASAAMTWGAIGGTLSNQTDLQNALDAKVPTSRTLTINGVTQDLSADRTFTISTGITIGSTAITSGVVGRILFEGAGNVVQESSSLTWDNTNSRLGIGTSSPNVPLEVVGSNLLGIRTQISVNNAFDSIQVRNSSTGDTNQVRIKFDNENTVSASSGGVIFYTGNNYAFFPQNSFGFWNHTSNGVIALATNNTERFRIFSTGNVAINTTTDAGFRLDVNGTARVQGNAQFGTGFYWDNTNNRLGIGTSSPSYLLHAIRNTPLGAELCIENLNTGINASSNFRFITNAGFTSIGMNGSNDTGVGSNRIYMYSGTGSSGISLRASQSTNDITMYTGGDTASNLRMRIFSTGNVGINTTTDAGFRLDVNGSGRFNNEFILNRSDGVEMFRMNNSPAVLTFNGNNSSTPTLRFHSQSNILFYLKASENRIGINTTTPNASAIMDVTSTTQGFLPPRMTTTERNAIASPAAGLVVYDNTDNKHYGYNGTTWNAFY